LDLRQVAALVVRFDGRVEAGADGFAPGVGPKA